jgi:hypothetical protein
MSAPCDSELAQVARELIRPAIEFSVGKLMVLEDNGRAVGCSYGLVLKQLMDALVLRITALCVIPCDNKLMPLGVIEQR